MGDMRTTVLGAGSWGTALAKLLADQGYSEKALRVAEDVLRKNPDDQRASAVRDRLQANAPLAEADVRWWQVLPLHPPGPGNSPYSAVSTFAGSEWLISPELLVAFKRNNIRFTPQGEEAPKAPQAEATAGAG